MQTSSALHAYLFCLGNTDAFLTMTNCEREIITILAAMPRIYHQHKNCMKVKAILKIHEQCCP